MSKLNVNKKVLVVDDMASLRTELIAILKECGFMQFVEAVDGDDAFNKVIEYNLKKQPFDVIFSDINMPNKNGIEFLQLTRKIPEYQKIPFILVSTENEKGVIVTAIASGANNYILKPFSKDLVKAKVMQTIK